MAKISDLSDAQLEKAFLKYQARFKEKQDDELRNILRQIRAEQAKRGITVPLPQKPVKSAPPRSVQPAIPAEEETELALLSELADRAVARKMKAKALAPARSRDEDDDEKTQITLLTEVADQAVSRKLRTQVQSRNRLTQRTRVVRGPRMSPMATNLMLGAGLVLGFSGTLLLLDYFFFGYLKAFYLAGFAYGFLVVCGIGLSKAAMVLSDDNT